MDTLLPSGSRRPRTRIRRGIGENILAIGLLGSLLFFALSRMRILALLRSHGITVYKTKAEKH